MRNKAKVYANSPPVSPIVQLSMLKDRDAWICPMCCEYLGDYHPNWDKKHLPNQCPGCGQKIDKGAEK